MNTQHTPAAVEQWAVSRIKELEQQQSVLLRVADQCECSRCVGTGTVQTADPIPAEFIECPDCAGTGYINVEKLLARSLQLNDLNNKLVSHLSDVYGDTMPSREADKLVQTIVAQFNSEYEEAIAKAGDKA